MERYVAIFKGVLFTPKSFYQSFKKEANQQSIGQSIGFIVIISLVGGILSAVIGIAFPNPRVSRWIALFAIIFLPIASIIGSFISAGVVWVICRILGSKPSYAVVFALMAALAAFMPLSVLFSRILILSLLVSIWSFISFVLGTIELLEVKPVRAWATFLTLFVVLLLSSFLLTRMSQNYLLEQQSQQSLGSALPSNEPAPIESAPVSPGTSTTPPASNK